MRRVFITLVCVVALAWPAECEAGWDLIKRYLQPGVVVVQETDTKIVLRAKNLKRDIVVADASGDDVDLYAVIERRRRSNPFRVWIASPRLLRDSDLPRHVWGEVFRTPFLRIIRVPRRP